MPRKFRKMCPSDYKDRTQSDSDHIVDPDYTQEAQSEPSSPKVSQGKGGCKKYRRRQIQKNMKSTPKSTQGGKSATSTQLTETRAETRKLGRSSNVQSRVDSLNEAKKKLEAKRNSRDSSFEEVQQSLQAKRDRITPTTPAEDDDEITKKPRKCKRKSPSVIWKHVIKTENLIQCNYCTKEWNDLFGSTSNPLKHIKQTHYFKLTEEQNESLSLNGKTT